MKKLLKNKRLHLLLFFVATLSIFFSWYLFHLTEIPVFADEAIYLNWAQRIINGDENLFISMYDGKPPLFMWLAGLSSLLFKDLLLAGRFVSVVSLFITTTLIIKNLKKKSVSWAYLALFAILGNTFLFFYSRMALLDTLFSSLLILFIFSWSNNKSKYSGWLTGVFLSLAFLTKTPAVFLFPLPFITLLQKRNKKTFINIAVVFSTLLLTLFVLKTSPWFPSLFSRSTDFTYKASDILSGHLSHIWPNLKTITGWLSFYLTWPLLVFSALGAIKGFKEKNNLVINLFFASLLFFLPLTILGKIITSRYFLFLGFTLPILASYYLSKIKTKYLLIIIATFLSITIPNNYQFQNNYFNSYLPKEDNGQYFRDWSSGIGLDHASIFINQKAQNNKVLVLTEGTFGTLPDGLFVYQSRIGSLENLEIVGVTSPESNSYFKAIEKSNAKEIYYIGNHNRIQDNFREKNTVVSSYAKKDEGPALEIIKISK